MLEYPKRIMDHIQRICSRQEDKLLLAAEWFAQALIDDKLVHTFGTGHSHMIGLELFVRAGGLANVNAMLDSTVMTIEGARRSAEIERIPGLAKIVWDQYEISEGDLFIIISNSGRNAMPIEMAILARERGHKVIAITSMEQSRKYPSRHPNGKKLYEVADLVIDNYVPSGDGLMHIDGELTGPPSSVSGIVIVNTIATEAMKMAVARGLKLPVYFSQNIDGYSNEELYALYEKRIRHL